MSIEKLTAIFRDTFGDNNLVLTRELTPKTLKGWDSFNHINLVLGVEAEFGLTFSTDEIQNVRSVAELVELLNAKGHVIHLD